MALTKEKNAQIAAMNAKGMCIEAIAKKAGVSKEDVRDSLESRGRSYIDRGLMTAQQVEDWIKELQAGGKAIADIMELTGLGKATIYKYLFYKGKIADKVDEYIKDATNRKTVLQNYKGEEFKAYVDSLADAITPEINNRAVKSCTPSKFEAQ